MVIIMTQDEKKKEFMESKWVKDIKETNLDDMKLGENKYEKFMVYSMMKDRTIDDIIF